MSGPRIAILGNAGGGKTTLARRLARRLDLPVVHVDAVQYRSGWRRTPEAECDAILREAAARSRWIIDGFGSDAVMQERIERADTVILVDFPLWRHYLWAARRQWAARRGPRDELPEGCPEFSLVYTFRLFTVMWRVHRDYTPRFRDWLEARRGDTHVVRIRTPAQWARIASGMRDR